MAKKHRKFPLAIDADPVRSNILRQAFHDSTDDDLDFCEERGEQPEPPFSGQILSSTTLDHHRQVLLAAESSQFKLNDWLVVQLKQGVEHSQVSLRPKPSQNQKTNRKNPINLGSTRKPLQQ
jgi:predicted HicB family RNase H-like nuclease